MHNSSTPDGGSTADGSSTADALGLVADELRALVDTVRAADQAPFERALTLLTDADRVFVHGAGRSGLALRMTAMRLMHLGLRVHVVGEATTPAIGRGDVLLVASGSGTTGGIVQAARTAADVGARVLAVSTTDDSPLAAVAEATLVLPAATKTDRSGTASAQYAGSLFEQGVALLGDALFHALWQRSGRSADELWPRHANLE
ncbi:6-phospho 3-hexuloisomerase [Curtobacterium citreum]|uniref:6-phospho-3-hexuloisomerase n=1 Tax=Curtobacterium citreum TaxID=2036 RepID=A0ABT2HKT9_9MICO|nr:MULTISPECIES: 6-phospho-3-hexuloisomerase [Curtobacterium]MCS6523880.1 6-phospho-3-hexuloisomerase [Curtobacterium citreum]RDH97894.1 6-phospho-3-hexuloisomerase [Curtobacterium sp. AG1037]TQJ28992.1 6-phospho-3-hexuloisomerase [Curtobacterium citreum]GGL88694.1 6-phospho 3-hexuloisomerase [Curtobacterium citreum]